MSSLQARNVAEVVWRETKGKNIYRAGYKGHVRSNLLYVLHGFMYVSHCVCAIDDHLPNDMPGVSGGPQVQGAW